MKHVTLVRHAKAEKAKEGLEDLNRKLKKKGKKEATEIAAKMKKMGMMPDLILSSPAKRSLKTAQIFAEKFKLDPAKIVETQELYTATSGDSFLKLVKELDAEMNSVMLVGHEPTLSDFASLLVANFNYELPGIGVFVIEFDTNSWKQITRQSGVIKSVQFPMTKSQEILFDQAVSKTLQDKIRANFTALFEEMSHQPGKKLGKLIKKQSKELTQKFLTSEKKRTTQLEAEITAALSQLKPKEVAKPEPEKAPQPPAIVVAAPPETNPEVGGNGVKTPKKATARKRSRKPVQKADVSSPDATPVQPASESDKS